MLMSMSLIMLTKWLVIGTFMSTLVSARRLHMRNSIQSHNEVIKKKPVPNVPSDTYEAYFYGIYDDASEVFSGYKKRPGHSSDDNTCETIRGVPPILRTPENLAPFGLDDFYQKYTETYGIPVVGSSAVSDEALQRACYVLRFLLADRKDLRDAFYESHGRVSVIGRNERLTQLPEYHALGTEYDDSTRGLGAVPVIPVTSAGEENILCEEDDLYLSEDILVREIAMGILHLAIKKTTPALYEEIQKNYIHAKKSGWWKETYAILTPDAYFGEGVQSFFDVNGFSHRADGRHNEVSIRTRLRAYDSRLYGMVQQVFPCANRYIGRCNSRGHEHHQKLNMDCGIPYWSRNGKRRRRLHQGK